MFSYLLPVSATTSPPRGDRPRRLAAAITALRERFGPLIIRTGADLVAFPPGEGLGRRSSGSWGLDLITNGLVRGGVVEYMGVEGSGAETLALAALAACQQAGGLGLLLDAEGSADPDALLAAGLDLERLVLACPQTTTAAWSVLGALARSGSLDLLLCSLDGLLGMPGPTARPSPARLLSRLAHALRGRPTTVLFTTRPRPVRGGQVSVVLAQVAAQRVLLLPEGPLFAPHGDVVALRARARVLKHHGFPHSLILPLEIGPAGPRQAAEVLALGRHLGCITHGVGGLWARDTALGRSPAVVLRALEADPALARDLEAQISAAWEQRTGSLTGEAS